MSTKLHNLFATIEKLGRDNSKRQELHEYCELHFNQIIKTLPRRILSQDAGVFLSCLYNGFPDHTSKKKVQLTNIVLETMRNESMSLAHCAEVMCQICMMFPKSQVEDLVRWSTDSVQSIVEDSDVNQIWRDVLPNCLNIILSHTQIIHCGTEMSGSEFCDQCVRTLCQCRWTEKQLVQLAAMFRDLKLSKNNHKQIVNKMCSYLVDVPPETLPPLAHQLLEFCKVYHIEIVLAYLAHYFNIRLYNKLEPPPPDSTSTTLDIEDYAQYSALELNRCLSTCIFHVTQAADTELIRKYLKLWPKNQLLRSPFLIDIALALTGKERNVKMACLDIMKAAIEQSILDQQRMRESAWVRSILPPNVDVITVLKTLTTESAYHDQLITMGLINLAFHLLSIPKHKPVASMCWSHGKLILVRLSKSQPDVTRLILKQLADKLAGELATQRQYSDCLYILCKLTPAQVERCPQLSTILENCQPTNEYRSTAAVLDAVHPLLSFSTKVRDTLVMVCRKGLFSTNTFYRCFALSGFLSVLRHIKLPKSLSGSQNQLSEQLSDASYLTQLTVDLHATQQGVSVTSRVRNESMCMEVLSILRRCLLQNAPIKQLLYSSIYDATEEKMVLHEDILELLYKHLIKYLPEDHSAILFEECVQVKAGSAVLVEPIGQLLYTIAQFLQIVAEEELEDILLSQTGETASAPYRSQLEAILTSLTGSDALINLDMDTDKAPLDSLTPESTAKCLKVQQRLQCLEALIGHQIMQWTSTTNPANIINKLHKCYIQLLENTKVTPKADKKGSKTLNDTKKTQESEKSQKSQNREGKGPMKLSNMAKNRTGPFKPLPCLWDLNLCIRVVQLLYSEDVTWSTAEERNQIRSRREFHHFVLKNILSVLTNGDIEKRQVVVRIPQIANILYTRCIRRFQHVYDFDENTALACIEVFRECLSLVLSPNFGLKVQKLLSTITATTDKDVPECTAAILEQVNKALRILDSETDSQTDRDVNTRKLVIALGQLAATVLENANLECHPALTNATNQLEQYVRVTQSDCLALIPPLLSANCRQHEDGALLDDLLNKLTAIMGLNDEETHSDESDTGSFISIDDKNGQIVLGYVCAHLTTRFQHVDHLLSRAKDLQMALKCSTHNQVQKIDKELEGLFRILVVQLSQLSSWCGKVARLQFQVGASSNKVFQTCTRLYVLFVGFIKQLTVYVGQDAALLHNIRLERLLKVGGKKLSSIIDNAISYMEASQSRRGSIEGAQVLRDTKCIPRLVLEAERFTESSLLLSHNTKVDLQQYLSLGTARDFRLKLKEMAVARQRDDTRDDNDAENGGEETVHISSGASDAEDTSETDEPNAKRRKA